MNLTNSFTPRVALGLVAVAALTVASAAPASAQTIMGTSGADHLVGTAHNDDILAMRGDDTIRGRAGNDELGGRDGSDVLHGGAGKDIVAGENGSDTVYGGPGNDLMIVDKGADTAYAGAGNDTIRLWHDSAPDHVDCGPGDDTVLIYTARTHNDYISPDCENFQVITDFFAGAFYQP